MTINRVRAFADMLAGQIHTSYTTAPGNLAYIASALDYLSPLGKGTGLCTVRDDTFAKVATLASLVSGHGAKLDIYAGYPSGAIPAGTASTGFITAMKAIMSACPGAVVLLEGPLEVDNSSWGVISNHTYGGKSGWAAAIQMQADLWNAFQGQVPVAMFSSAVPGNGSAGGPMAPAAGYGNFSNVHCYPHNGNASIVELAGTVKSETGYCPTLPITMTEVGFNDATGSSIGGGVLGVAAVNAKYTLNLVLNCLAAGIKLAALYEIFDDTGNGATFEAHWGLFTATGQPKLSATYLRNMLTVLGDASTTAETFTPTAYPVTVTGLPVNGNWLQFQDAGGKNFIVPWIDQTIYLGGKASTAPTHQVTVTLPAAANSNVFDPTVGTAAIANTTTATISLTLSDHPQIVVVPPSGAVVVPPMTPPPVVPPPVVPPVAPPPVVIPPVVVPPVTPPAAASKEGTIVSTVGPVLNANGHKWTLGGSTGALRIYVDGVLDPVSYVVGRLMYFGGRVWQETTGNVIWSKALPTDAWAPPTGLAEHDFITTVMSTLNTR
jgi:hypothetical protein